LAASILLHIARMLAAPLILAAARGQQRRDARRRRRDRHGYAAGQPLLVGGALGRHGDELLTHLPHLPLDWAALNVAAGAWIAGARRSLQRAHYRGYAAIAGGLREPRHWSKTTAARRPSDAAIGRPREP